MHVFQDEVSAFVDGALTSGYEVRHLTSSNFSEYAHPHLYETLGITPNNDLPIEFMTKDSAIHIFALNTSIIRLLDFCFLNGIKTYLHLNREVRDFFNYFNEDFVLNLVFEVIRYDLIDSHSKDEIGTRTLRPVLPINSKMDHQKLGIRKALRRNVVVVYTGQVNQNDLFVVLLQLQRLNPSIEFVVVGNTTGFNVVNYNFKNYNINENPLEALFIIQNCLLVIYLVIDFEEYRDISVLNFVRKNGIRLETVGTRGKDPSLLPSNFDITESLDLRNRVISVPPEYASQAQNKYSDILPVRSAPSYSVVILMHNNEDIIEKCIRSFVDLGSDVVKEIIVVDNKSTDKSIELVKSKFPEVLVLLNETNGCSSGRNLGVKSANQEFIAFFDSDQWVTSDDCFYESAALLEGNLKLGAIGWNAGWFDSVNPSIAGEISEYLTNRGSNEQCDLIGYRDDIGFLGTCGFFIRKSVFEATSGFDVYYDPTCYEDTDLCFQLKELGYTIGFRNFRGIHHNPHQTTKANSGSRDYELQLERNRSYFNVKWQQYPDFFTPRNM